ncbi:MAG: hypothetical protein M5U28_11660 [Sandaracinaceae bacterium]|nr:hypothetical protein [Sandaracinaceae bacterium]
MARAELAGARSAGEVSVALASALRLRDSSLALGRLDAGDLSERVDAAIEVGEVELLVLDDAEGAVDDLAARVARWLELAPHLSVLASTRQALRVRGEAVLEIDGLELPADASIEAIAASDAARLLLARAPRVSLDASSAPAIARLVSALDGNPLAIELAAARLSSLGLSDLAPRLASGLDLLDRAPRGEGARHSSLRRAIEASWALATGAERALLMRCAPFRGWLDVDAVESVADGVIEDPLDALHGARERSLIAMSAAGERSRYVLSGPIRAFAEERLEETGRAEEARARHAGWLARRAAEAAARWRSEADDEGIAFLREHQADLAAAIDATRDAELHRAAALRVRSVARAARAPRGARGDVARPAGGRARSGARGPAAGRARGRARARRGGGGGAGRAGSGARRHDRAARAGRDRGGRRAAPPDARAARRRGGGAPRRARARAGSRDARAGPARPRPRRARPRRPRRGGGALPRGARARGRPPLLEARLSCDLGGVRLQQRRLVEAREHLERARAGSERASDPITVGLTEGNLAILAQEEGRLDEAAAAFARGMESLARAGHSLYEAHLGVYLAFLEHESGALDRAAQRYERSVRALESIGDRRMAGVACAGLGAAEAHRGRLDAARDAFTRAERAITEIGDAGLALALELHRAQLTLTRAEAASDPTAARALRAEVEALLGGAGREQLDRSDDARIAARILRARLGARIVRVRRDGSEVQAPDGARVDLGRRDVLKRIVRSLALARAERPGVAVPLEALVAEGWPGERMRWESALNRLEGRALDPAQARAPATSSSARARATSSTREWPSRGSRTPEIDLPAVVLWAPQSWGAT